MGTIAKLIQAFKAGATLKAAELNSMVDKINELIDDRLQVGTEEGTAYDGASGATLEQLVRELVGSSGTMYSVYVRNNLESLNFAAQYGAASVIDFTFISQYRDDISEPYKNTGELGMCTVMVKNNKYTDFTVVKQMEISSNVSIKLDVADWLSSGSNSIKITVKGENTERETSPTSWTVQLTSLGVSAPNFAWWTAYSDSFSVPMIISGNISKTLHVEIEGDGYNTSYEKNLGLSVYTDTPYLFEVEHPDFTGVFTIRFWLSNSDNTITTKAVSIQFMCVAKAGEESLLMCVNSVADTLTNWQDNTVFEYAVYNGQSTTAAVRFDIYKEDAQIYEQAFSAVATGTKNVLTYPMEVDTDDESDFEVRIEATSDDHILLEGTAIQVNNSLGFSATSGAVFYLNPRTRYNSQANYKSVINEATGEEVAVEWKDMNWGNDGWVTDDNGTKALKIFANSKAVIGYAPFIEEAARKGKTIEIDFMVENAADATQDIIRIAGSDGTNRLGLTVSGENVSMFSQSRQDSTTQDVPLDNGVRIRLTVVIMPDAYGNSGFNLVCVYINGKKNRQFTYESNDYFRHEGKIELGNDAANLYIYSMRVYNKALPSDAVQKNYINLLGDIEEKQSESDANEVLDAEGVNIDFEKTKLLYNVFVCDTVFPSFTNPAGVKCNMWVYFKDRPHNNFSLTNLLMEGQGTSSKKYYEWNERWKFGSNKDSSGTKIPTIATYADGTTDKNKVFFASGVPKSGRLTAKKNWASSMQDHKAGCVGAYTDLYREMGLSNEAMTADADVRISVYQEPFIGFAKTINEEGKEVYTCMGEFTLGPDKGDALCFGYDTSAYPDMISVEGSDNAPLGALFRVPWNKAYRYWAYNADEEAYQYNETNCWDFDAGATSDGEPKSTELWVKAYNAVYVCSNRIKPFEGTLDELNAQVADLRGTGYEYWIAKAGDANLYNLYYYEAAEGRFMPSDTGDGTINLKQQLSAYLSEDLSTFTPSQLNEMFINARASLFRESIPAIWSVDDAVFHYCFTEFIAGTDNRAKNTYPYNFGTEGALWRWRQDDLDTILPIDNQGQDRKPYYVEMHDYYDNGQPVWNGETSVFWNLLEIAFADEIKAGMKSMLSAMETLSGKTTGTPYEKVYAFYQKYFLQVKNYFPSTMVNADAKRYEVAKLAYNAGEYTNDTDPITQSHGDFFSAESAWVKKRIMYMMSKYSYGLFSADGTDTIIVRAAGDLIDYDITPAFDMYPAIANGTSIVRGERTKAGDTLRMTIDLGGSADQQNIIEGASWLLSIGDWHTKNVSGTMVVRGKRLTELVLGSRTETPVISITGLTLSDCGSLQMIELSNISTLQGTLDLSAISNIRQVYAGGTGLTQIKLPSGGGLLYVEYPDTNRYISLQSFAVLTADNVILENCAANITDFFVVDCPKLNPVNLLNTILVAQSDQESHALKRVRAVGFDATLTGSAGVEQLDRLAVLVDGTYEGLDSDGYAGSEELPVLDGTINVNANVYEDTIESLKGMFNRLTINVTGAYYIRFADALVMSLIAAKCGDGTGTTKEMAAKVTSAGNLGLSDRKTEITSFDEFQYFTGITSLGNLQFNGWTALKSIVFPDSITSMGWGTFGNCTSLERVKMSKNITSYGDQTFSNCQSLEGFESEAAITNLGGGCFQNAYLLQYVRMPNAVITKINSTAFSQCYALEEFDIPESVTTIGANAFVNCKALRHVVLPAGFTSMDWSVFQGCTSLEYIVCKPTTPPSCGNNCFSGSTCNIYVPDESVEDYKTASGWTGYASRIKPMSEFEGEE
jgi:hypothetical protein